MPYTEPSTGAHFVTIASTYRDNTVINRDEYARNLKAACSNDPELAAAWLDGNWSIIRGAYFSSVLDEHRNMLEPWEKIPRAGSYDGGFFTNRRATAWRAYLAHDFGVSAPSVTYICAESPGVEAYGIFYPKGSILLLGEYASSTPDDPTKGLGLTVPELAGRIRDMCDQWGVEPEGVADDAIFNRTGSELGSIADEFRRAGVRFSRARKGSRIAGWQLMRRLLVDAGKTDVPGLYISRSCRYFWQTIPSLPRDPRRIEDVDSRGADHAADACRYALSYDEPVLYTGIGSAC